ncbi:26S proteasome non-ATPase regulatory subunit 10 like protein [Verticillium longisporum]|nr:26S proteasome non-ATPase regulatory subunit 10 like protein [Verticillium longisporum]
MAAVSRWHHEHDTIVDEASKGDTDLLQSLIQKYNSNVNSPKLFNGSRPIHSAGSRGTVDHVRILLDGGADVNARNNNGRTPLHWAAERGSWNVVELLLSRGADAGIRSEEESLQTVLQVAQAARAGPVWALATTNGWDEDRIDPAREPLVEAWPGRETQNTVTVTAQVAGSPSSPPFAPTTYSPNSPTR